MKPADKNKTKVCGECNTEYPLSPEFFHRHKGRKDGFVETCKECRRRIRSKDIVRAKRVELAYSKKRKICTACNKELPAIRDFFSPSKTGHFGLTSRCKTCRNEISRIKVDVNTDRNISHVCTGCNVEKPLIEEFFNISYDSTFGLRKCCKKCIKKRDSNREITESSRKSRRERFAKYYQDPSFRFTCCIRSGMGKCLKGRTKMSHSIEYTGLSLPNLRIRLESMFDEKMNWGNYGEWHLDHIRPVSSFNLHIYKSGSDGFENMLKRIWNYTNLQPLWATDNLSKQDKYEPTWQDEFEDQIFFYQNITSMIPGKCHGSV
jgi:hypothetical protein